MCSLGAFRWRGSKLTKFAYNVSLNWCHWCGLARDGLSTWMVTLAPHIQSVTTIKFRYTRIHRKGDPRKSRQPLRKSFESNYENDGRAPKRSCHLNAIKFPDQMSQQEINFSILFCKENIVSKTTTGKNGEWFSFGRLVGRQTIHNRTDK